MNTEIEDKKHRHDGGTTAMLSKPEPAPAPSGWDDDEEEKSAFQKYRLPVIAGIILTTGIGFVAKSLSSGKSAAPPPKEEVMVFKVLPQATPPPAVPTPPPPPMEQIKEKMIVEEKPEEPTPEPTPQVETALKGPAAGGMAIRSGTGSGIFSNQKTVNAEAMRRSAYAGQVKSRIQQALESNSRTRKAGMKIEVHVWPDATGRISRAKLANSTGDTALDDLIRDQILTGLQISQPPPEGMPVPIRMMISARRPN
ncbi:MAG: TonB C-terminal domain-containing protein [Chthoniobacteraceae bacterium]